MEIDRTGWTASSEAWIRRMDTFDFARQVLLDGPMMRLCGDVTDKDVIDIGCGEGRFCRMLAAAGAKPVGIDPTEPLLQRAHQLDPSGTYLQGRAEALPFENQSFDVAVFYLTLLDIPDYRKAIAEANRVLRPGGRMVVGNLAPHASTRPTGWVRDDSGKALYFPIDNYADETEMEVEWAGIKVLNYHRPLSAYMEAFLSHGLILREYLEPVPSLEQVAEHPDWADDRRVPYTMAMLWEKPGQ